jgi:hypothetical protein
MSAMTDPANFLFLLALLLVWCGFFFIFARTHTQQQSREHSQVTAVCVERQPKCLESSPWKEMTEKDRCAAKLHSGPTHV